MDVPSLARATPPRRLQVSYLRWGAVLAGTIVGFASYLLLALLGVAAGLTALDPGPGRDVGMVAPLTGAWTVVSILIAVWLGGNVAGRLSGLARRSDGVLHGFVVWGTLTLLLGWLTTTSVGPVLGGAFGMLGEELLGLGQAASRGDRPLSERLDALSATSWWLFSGLVLSLGLGLWGGVVGVRATAERASGDHESERRMRA